MVNLLISIVAIILAFRMISPLLRTAIKLLTKLLSFGFVIAAAILVAIAILTHGAFI